MTPVLDLSAILDDRSTRVVVCCGAGGVGKTTTAAALALRAAERGRTVAVLTIDPARRLAQALGMAELTNRPQPVPLAGDGARGIGQADRPDRDGARGIDRPDRKGTLDAMMLDMRRTFDDMVIAHSTPEKARQILDNSFYQTVASSFSGTQEYMAMEKLGQLIEEAKWDLIVVDTPPSRNALDFLDAPERLGSFLDGRLIRALTSSGRGIGRVMTGVVALAMRGVSTIVGGEALRDVSDFIRSLDTMFGGFRERAAKTYELLSRPGTRFVVVSTAEPDALREAAFFVDRLSAESMPLAGLVLNRTHPNLTSIPGGDAATGVRAASDDLTRGVLRVHATRAEQARRELRLLKRFTTSHPRVPVIGVPSLAMEVASLEALAAVGDQLTATAG